MGTRDEDARDEAKAHADEIAHLKHVVGTLVLERDAATAEVERLKGLLCVDCRKAEQVDRLEDVLDRIDELADQIGTEE